MVQPTFRKEGLNVAIIDACIVAIPVYGFVEGFLAVACHLEKSGRRVCGTTSFFGILVLPMDPYTARAFSTEPNQVIVGYFGD